MVTASRTDDSPPWHGGGIGRPGRGRTGGRGGDSLAAGDEAGPGYPAVRSSLAVPVRRLSMAGVPGVR